MQAHVCHVSQDLPDSPMLSNANHPVPSPALPECSVGAVADLLFLLDGSWSVGRANFKLVRGLVAAVTSAFQVGEDKTRVGVVQYGDDARTEFNLNSHTTRPTLLRAIGSMAYKGGGTRTGEIGRPSEKNTSVKKDWKYIVFYSYTFNCF